MTRIYLTMRKLPIKISSALHYESFDLKFHESSCLKNLLRSYQVCLFLLSSNLLRAYNFQIGVHLNVIHLSGNSSSGQYFKVTNVAGFLIFFFSFSFLTFFLLFYHLLIFLIFILDISESVRVLSSYLPFGVNNSKITL